MTIWTELGIDPTQDSAAIKSAYAARLKVTRPDENPEGFQRLRAAYSAALRSAGQSSAVAVPSLEPAETGERKRLPDNPPKPGAAEALSERDEAIKSLRRIFSAGNGEAAVAAIDDAIARQILPIDLELQFTNALIDILYSDRSIAARHLLELAKRFGWYDVPDQLRGHNSRAEQRLCARIDAELWIEETRHQARSWKYWIGQREPAAARLLLGSKPTVFAWLATPEPPLSRKLAEALLHAPQIEGAVDLNRVARIQRIVFLRRQKRFQAAAVFFNVAVMFVLSVLGMYFRPEAAMGVMILAFVWYRYAGVIRGTYRTDLIFPLAAVAWVVMVILHAHLLQLPADPD